MNLLEQLLNSYSTHAKSCLDNDILYRMDKRDLDSLVALLIYYNDTTTEVLSWKKNNPDLVRFIEEEMFK